MRPLLSFALFLLSSLFLSAQTPPPTFALSTINANPKADHLSLGLHVQSALGGLVVEFPQIVPAGDGAWKWPTHAQLTSDATTTSIPYPSGASFTYTIQADGSVLCTYKGLPADAQGLWFQMMIPTTFRDGGHYAFDATAATKPFPPTPAGMIVDSGRGGPFTLLDSTGAGIVLDAPSARQSLKDYRPSWNAFTWSFLYPAHGDGSFVLRVTPYARTP